MIKKYPKKVNLCVFAVYIMLLSFCIQHINILNVFSHNIKIFRIIVVGLFLCLFFKKKVDFFPSKKIFIMLLYMILVTAISCLFLHCDRLILDYLFAYLIIVIVYNYGKNIKYEQWIKIIQTCSIFMMIMILLNIAIQKDFLIDFIKNPTNQHPRYDSVFPGGLNLDATWIAMFSVFYVNKPVRAYIYIFISVLISMIFSSRVGLIINVLSFLFILFNQFKGLKKESIINGCIFLFTISVLFIVFLILTGIADNIVKRLFEVGSDGGSQGRLKIWKNVLPNFIKNPLGYGVGNSMSILKKSAWYGEDNLHNIYFQMLLDLGFIGLIFFLNFVYNFIKKNLKILFKNPIIYFILLYFVIGLIQFKGAEIFVYYIIGVYLIFLKSGELYEG